MTAIIQFPARLLVFTVGFFFYAMEVAADWAIGAPTRTEYVRTGACYRCGRCCRLLALEMPRLLANRECFVRMLIWWHRFGFNFRYEGREKKWLIYRCGYLKDGQPIRCRIYPFRHRLCRFYPRQRLYGHPKTHRDCGFKFRRRDGRPTFDEILDEKRKTG